MSEMRASGIDPMRTEMMQGNGMYRLATEVTSVIADAHLVLEAELPAGLVTRRRRQTP